MNAWIVNTLAFVAGGASGYFLSRHLLQKKYQARTDEEIASYKALKDKEVLDITETILKAKEEEVDSIRIMYGRKLLVNLQQEGGEVPPELTEVYEEIVERKDKKTGKTKKEKRKGTKLKGGLKDLSEGPVVTSSIDYGALNGRNTGGPNADKHYSNAQRLYKEMVEAGEINETPEDYGGEIGDDKPELIGAEFPYVISHQQYTDECDHFDKLTYFYYLSDDVVATEGEEVVDDVDGSCGFDVLAELETQTTAWSRNESLGEDYEVVLVRGSYSEMIMEIPMSASPNERRQAEKRFRDRQRQQGTVVDDGG